VTLLKNTAIPFVFSDADLSWSAFLCEQRPVLQAIARQAGDCFSPPGPRVLRFAQLPLSRIRVVILGQDPYPAPGAATGRAFEVGGLRSWEEPFRQVSLKNIVRSLYARPGGGTPYTPYREVLTAMGRGEFFLLPPDRLFDYWQEQGVLLLNTSLTVNPGKPGSHGEWWRPFTRALLETISRERPRCRWFLWGAHAGSFEDCISGGIRYQSRHPMMCSNAFEDDFLKNPCFEETAREIDWTGIRLLKP
jgi:uracil-DNA glycosylase